MAYPSSIDTFAGTAAQGTSLLASPDHSAEHRTLGSAVGTIENVLGTTAGTGVLKNFAPGNLAARQNNETFGTPTFTLGSDAQGDLFYRSAGGTVTRLGIGTNTQVLTTNGTTPSWGAASSGYSILQFGGTISSDLSVVGTAFSPVTGSTVQVITSGTYNVLVTISGQVYVGAASSHYAELQLLRGTTVLKQIVDFQDTTSADHNISLTYFDPNVAAGTTNYIVQIACDNGSGTVHIDGGSGHVFTMYALAMQ